MDAGKCMKLLRDIEKSGTKLIYTYCGVETLLRWQHGHMLQLREFHRHGQEVVMGTDPERVDHPSCHKERNLNRDFESGDIGL